MPETTDTDTNAPDGPPTAAFNWRGVDLTVVVDPDEWPFDAARALEDGKGLRFVDIVLGDKQMRAVRRRHPQLKASDGAGLMDTIMELVKTHLEARQGE